MIGLVTAGARSTGNTGECFNSAPRRRANIHLSIASWLLTFLGCHPKWRDAARAEVSDLISRQSLETISAAACHDGAPSSATSLSSVPLCAWESETPVMDMLIRETLRIAQPHTAMRRNVGPETYIDGKAIPTGTLVVYPFSNVHLNPALYPDPWRFDPTRPHHPQADCAYVGWGGGKIFFALVSRHTCPQAEPPSFREGGLSWLADSEIDDEACHGAAAAGL